MGHAFDYKLNLTGNTPGGNLDRTLLNNAYPTIHGIADEDIEERRAVNTQLRSVIQQKSGKSASDLDTYIQNMDTKAMQNAVKSMHTDYLKSTAVSDESLPAIKSALQDVAYNPLRTIIQQESDRTGDDLGFNIAAYGGNIYDGTTESSQQMNNNNSSWWERTTNAVKGFFSSKKVRKRYKSLGGTINLFANGGRTQFNKDYPGLAGIQFNVVPDSNFNAKNVGFGNIEYMPQGEQGVQYTPDYYYSNPDPTTNNIVYNPEAYSSQQAVNEAIALDAISHAGHQNATYDALHALLGNEYPKEAVAQARDAVGNDALFDQEMGNPYSETRQFIYPAAVDGQVRAALFEEMHPNKQDSAYEEQNYYPYFREEFQKNESEDANRYLSDLSKYIKTGKKPKYVLPEITVKGKRK